MEATLDVTTLVGYHYRIDDYYEVGREKIREYARAVQDYHPAHWKEAEAAVLGYSGLVTPTTFFSILGMLANRRLFESVITGYEGFVQTDQVFELFKPVVAGERLTSDVELEAIRRIAGKDLVTIKNTFSDESGEVVHVMHTTVVGITAEDVDPGVGAAMSAVLMHGVDFGIGAGAPTAPEGPIVPAPVLPLSEASRTRTPRTAISFDEVSVGDELPTRTATLTRGDLVNYAGVSGDANPIHWDESVARLTSLPNVIAHGMLTMGLGAGFLTEWLGDPGALTRFSVRLSSYTIVDAGSVGSVEFSGRIKSLNPETRTATVVLTAKSGGRKIFGLATADVRLA